jgi:tetrahydromethanopterin S-methyltransferase subunit G
MGNMKKKKITTIENLSVQMMRGFRAMDKRFEAVDKRFDDFAILVNRGFQHTEDQLQKLEGEVNEEFRKVHSSLDRIERKIEYHDDQIFSIQGRLKKVESRVGIL